MEPNQGNKQPPNLIKNIKAVRVLSMLLEDHPGSWLLAGTALLIFSNGNIHWKAFSLDLSQSMTPLLRGCFIVLGSFVFLLGCYLIVPSRVANQKFVNLMFISVWITFIGITFYTVGTGTKRESPFHTWDYSFEDRIFKATIRPIALRRYSGQSLLLAVLKEDNFIDDCGTTIKNHH
ncbi:MAG TPA: hypothetical protein VMF08_06575 [Candidatus Sulfotelmatobacter sp.]|nr:hypothetical protein [Candidatus Sulfotelmatobacter sp.]